MGKHFAQYLFKDQDGKLAGRTKCVTVFLPSSRTEFKYRLGLEPSILLRFVKQVPAPRRWLAFEINIYLGGKMSLVFISFGTLVLLTVTIKLRVQFFNLESIYLFSFN